MPFGFRHRGRTVSHQFPRVPGHEAVGRIDALGAGVQGWAIGERVGVGFLGGSCGYCEFCRNGDLVNCRNQEYTGIHHDGGYAEVMLAKASGLMRSRRICRRWMLRLCSARGSQPSAHCKMRRQRAAILLRSSESVGWAISAFNMRGRWGLRLRPSPAAPTKRILRRNSAPIITSTAAHPTLQPLSRRSGATDRFGNGIQWQGGQRDVQGVAPQRRLHRPWCRA